MEAKRIFLIVEAEIAKFIDTVDKSSLDFFDDRFLGIKTQNFREFMNGYGI